MAKRVRIVMLLSMLCLCISLLVVGVFAVSTITFSASSSLNYEKPTPVYGYFIFTGRSRITGLSNAYLSLETKPETLVIPSTDSLGNSVYIDSGTSSSPTFKGLESSNIIIEDGVDNIGAYAFYGCSSLTSVTIPSSLSSVYGSAFSDCTNLKSVNYLGNVSQWCNIQFNDTFANPTYYTNTLNINGEELTSLNIPEGVETIKQFTFENCTNITTVTLPSSLKSIGINAFQNCDNISSMNYLGTLSDWCEISFSGSDSNPVRLTEALYINGEEIINLEIPEGIEAIKAYAFYNCKSLISLNFPSSLKSIGSNAFWACRNIRNNVTIPSSVTSIGTNAFYFCLDITSLTINTKPGYVWQKASNSTFTSDLSIVDLSNASQNATWFKGTSGYYNYYWRQIEESAV